MKVEIVKEDDILNEMYNDTMVKRVQNLVSQEEIKDMKDHEVYGIIQSQTGEQRKLRVEDMRKNITETLSRLDNKLKAINQVRSNIND